jgi:S1-C subfamily serine protease
VRSVWRSVFALTCTSRKGVYIASAFLVARRDAPPQRRRGAADYFFITAGHAIEACRNARWQLAENINQAYFESDGITVATPPHRLSAVDLVDLDDKYDLALIKVRASAALPIGAPVAVGDECRPDLGKTVFAVGFPGVEKRRSLGLKREQKRWSRGTIVGLGKARFHAGEEIYIASNLDSLPGSSGGPVVDEAGRLIGVVAKGAAAPENSYRYDVDPKRPRDWQTFIAPCTAVRQLLQRARLD